MHEGNPIESTEASLLKEPAVAAVLAALEGVELSEENVRKALNETNEDFTDEIAVAETQQERDELMRRASFLVNRGEEIIAMITKRAERM